MSTAALSPPISFLKEGNPTENLAYLSNPLIGSMPKTGCITRQIYERTPFFKPSRKTIQAWSINLGFLIAISNLTYQLLPNIWTCTAINMLENTNANFFSALSNCFTQTVHSSNTSTNRLWNAYSFVFTTLFSIGVYTTARLAFKDYQETNRIALLDQEYSSIAQTLLTELDKAKQEKNEKNLQTIKQTANKIKINLPLIETRLLETTQLSDTQITPIIKKLQIAADRVVKTQTDPFTAEAT